MVATTIFDSTNFAFMVLGIDSSWRLVYAVDIWLHPCGTYQHFGTSKMAAGRHLEFPKVRIFDQMFHCCYARVYAVLIAASSSFHGEVNNILVNPRWGAVAILGF